MPFSPVAGLPFPRLFFFLPSLAPRSPDPVIIALRYVVIRFPDIQYRFFIFFFFPPNCSADVMTKRSNRTLRPETGCLSSLVLRSAAFTALPLVCAVFFFFFPVPDFSLQPYPDGTSQKVPFPQSGHAFGMPSLVLPSGALLLFLPSACLTLRVCGTV